jgi:7-cyano-7-deazaguanine synthase in queuosine biosynthesis
MKAFTFCDVHAALRGITQSRETPMQPEPLVLCGGATRPGEPWALRLATSGRFRNVMLRLDDISKNAIKMVPASLIDLLEIATYVYCADQAISRAGEMHRAMAADWYRSVRFVIPVRNPAFWNRNQVLGPLRSALSFLSDDNYVFEFEKAISAVPFQDYVKLSDDGAHTNFKADEVLLFSGGLDSLAGAIEELSKGKRVVLVSHHASTTILGCQKYLVAKLKDRFPKQIMHFPILMTTAQTLPAPEHTHRSQSFLYAAFACTIAALFEKTRIRFFENGILSINLPTTAQLIGAHATRTIHPSVLEAFRGFFSAAIGKFVDFDNPFIWKTKADVVRSIVDQGFGELIRHTISCTRVRDITKYHTHCGCCSQCIDRRFAILAADAAEQDPVEMYDVELLTGERRKPVDQAIAEAYVLSALELRDISDHAFFDRFSGETMRVYSSFPLLKAEDVARQVLDLHQRHGQAIGEMLELAVGKYRAELVRRSLPPSSILMMTIAHGAVPFFTSVVRHGDPPQKLIEDERIVTEHDRHEPAVVASDRARKPSSVLPGENALAQPKLAAEFKARKRGQPPRKLEQVKEAMRREIRDGRQTTEGLRTMLERNLATTYGVSRDTARKARITVLSEFVEHSTNRPVKSPKFPG